MWGLKQDVGTRNGAWNGFASSLPRWMCNGGGRVQGNAPHIRAVHVWASVCVRVCARARTHTCVGEFHLRLLPLGGFAATVRFCTDLEGCFIQNQQKRGNLAFLLPFTRWTVPTLVGNALADVPIPLHPRPQRGGASAHERCLHSPPTSGLPVWGFLSVGSPSLCGDFFPSYFSNSPYFLRYIPMRWDSVGERKFLVGFEGRKNLE